MKRRNIRNVLPAGKHVSLCIKILKKKSRLKREMKYNFVDVRTYR